jgi:hypothetical protein
MMMEEYKYHNLVRQLNEKRLIFDEIMHINQFNIPIICVIFTWGYKSFTL